MSGGAAVAAVAAAAAGPTGPKVVSLSVPVRVSRGPLAKPWSMVSRPPVTPPPVVAPLPARRGVASALATSAANGPIDRIVGNGTVAPTAPTGRGTSGRGAIRHTWR